MPNLDRKTVDGFGAEWRAFDQSELGAEARRRMFDDYFHLFPWDELPSDAVGADLGCGSGRWAQEVAPRVGHLLLVDASPAALEVARRNLRAVDNVSFHLAAVNELPTQATALDFAYSLGVLHHLPDTAAALGALAQRLKPGAPFLVYLYYALDDRPAWFRALWRASDLLRRLISRLPFALRYALSQAIALLVYLPLARIAALLATRDALPRAWPLAHYRDKPFYVMRTDALDRFGTRLEHRFTRQQIERMLGEAGFGTVRFSERPPYWTALTRKR